MTPTRPRRNSASDARTGGDAELAARALSDAELARRALEAISNAHSPYSKIRVGAALLASDGRVFTGCNVENASFGLTICAERTALVKAISEGARQFEAMAIAAETAKGLMPCGACRQALSEFAPRLRILIVGPGARTREASLENLLPEAFGPADIPSGPAGVSSAQADIPLGHADLPSAPADVD